MGAQSHDYVISCLLEQSTFKITCIYRKLVVLVHKTKPILHISALFTGWKLFCSALGTLKPVRRQPDRIGIIYVSSPQAVLRLTIK